MSAHGGWRRHATAANVLATAALVASLAGSAVAATRVGSAEIRDGTVASRDIRNRDVRTVDLRNGSVTAARLARGAVGAAGLAVGSVGGVAVRDGSLTGAHVADGSIRRADLAPELRQVQTVAFSRALVAGGATAALDLGPLHADLGCETGAGSTVRPAATWTTTVDDATYMRTSTPDELFLLRLFNRGQADTVDADGQHVTTYIAGTTHVRVRWSSHRSAESSCRIAGIATIWDAG